MKNDESELNFWLTLVVMSVFWLVTMVALIGVYSEINELKIMVQNLIPPP